MTEEKHITISTKYNLIIGVINGVWLFLFLFLIKPFKQVELDRLQLFYNAISMCLIIILSYFFTIIIEKKIYKKYPKWNIKYEIQIFFIFIALSFIGTFIIYKSIADGSYNLQKYFLKDYLPTALILLPITIILRKYFLKLSNKIVNKKAIYIYGDNKLDYLKINKNDIISVSSLQNYVEISFLINNQLHKKIIRSSLKKIHSSSPFLIKVHRSHLINPTHFISFKDHKNLTLTMKDIPFSNKYKENIFFIPK